LPSAKPPRFHRLLFPSFACGKNRLRSTALFGCPSGFANRVSIDSVSRATAFRVRFFACGEIAPPSLPALHWMMMTCISWMENQQTARIAPKPIVFPSTLTPNLRVLWRGLRSIFRREKQQVALNHGWLSFQ
jgi:hypothetical protein